MSGIPLILGIIAGCLQLATGANILFMHPVISYSHRLAMMPLANALASVGHRVTYISTLSGRGEFVHPEITEIVPPEIEKWVQMLGGTLTRIENRIDGTEPPVFTYLDEVDAECCRRQLISPQIQAWLSTQDKIDVIVVDYYANCALGLAHKYRAKVIVVYPTAITGKEVDLYQLPLEAGAAYVDCSTWQGCKIPMSFMERVKAALLPAIWRYQEWKSQDALYRAFEVGLGLRREEIPDLDELKQNIALVFMTSNYITEQAKSLPPMFVSVPGLQVVDAKPLPEDIQRFIDADHDSDGFVYMSLGSLLKPQNLPLERQEMILKTMESFPRLQFLWKWDGSPKDDQFKGVLNLMIRPWFPQQDLLGHPKIRGFVTQGGRPSTQESLSNGVPMITFAVLGGRLNYSGSCTLKDFCLVDQDYNAGRLEDIGVAIQLEITTATVAQFQKAVQEIAYNPVYNINALKQSQLQMDLPMKPIDTAVWWTEYVLRHDDLTHLKPPGRHQAWYQRHWLDVLGFLLACCVLALWLVFKVLMWVFEIFVCILGGVKGRLKVKDVRESHGFGKTKVQ